MFELLYRYLILYKKASVPGIGLFFIDRKPARLDFANKIFVSPIFRMSFRPQESLIDNGLYSFISHEQKVNKQEAISRYYNFANDIKETLKRHQEVTFPGIGLLSQNAEGEIFFKPVEQIDRYFPPVASERVIRENTEHHILVGNTNRTNTQMKEILVGEQNLSSENADSWWIFAIALGIISIAGIVYYYLHNGSLH